MVVDVQMEPSFTASRLRLLFEGQYGNDFDVAPDGQRFLMIQPAEQRTKRLADERGAELV